MNIRVDRDGFDKCQLRLVQEIARDVRGNLASAGLSDEQLYETTEAITFGVAAIIDASRIMELDGKPLRPFLTFADDDSRETLVCPQRCSSMHEAAIGAVEALFEDEGAG